MRTTPPDLARSALDAAPDAMIIIDGAGIVRYTNRQVSALFGFEHDEIIGQKVELLIPERFHARHVAHRGAFLGNVRVRPMGQGLELFGRRRDGTEFPVEISLSPVHSESDTLVAAAIRDVTARRRVEAELRHLQSISDTALSSGSTETLVRALLARLRSALQTDTATILLADAQGQNLIPFASDGMEGEIGGELAVPVGQGAAGRIARSAGPVIFKDLRDIEVVSPVLRSRVRSLLGTRLMSEGRLVGVVHAGSSTLRAFTADDTHLFSLAADRIGMAIERARLLELEQAARRAAESANQGKSRFLATASHDLRQPLQTLEMLNGALRRRATDPYSIEALSQQEQAIGAMSRLLNALLDISKLESGAIRPEPSDFTVEQIFEEMRLEFNGIASSKGLRLEVETCADVVHSDPSLVEQILRNLVSNAIKYTAQGYVRLRCLHEAALVRLEVLDTGVGIPADELPRIYDEFYQVGVPTNISRDGYGLGLAIVQRLAKLLTLKLDVSSEVGKGSAFAVILPKSSGPSAGDPHSVGKPSVSSATQSGEARVLLVEDNDAVRRSTSLLLELEGYHVTSVTSLGQARQHVEQGHRVDLLISDYHLNDGETGAQVIHELRRMLDVPLRAVLTTGDTSAAIKQLPQDRHLRIASKPIKAEELLSMLQALLTA